uniref:A kinase (PRKA) anchor protein 9 n=1 Tax=Mastacembelus armatus TaxID=205130 RepID=A0A3Q3M890_9TELE
MQEEVELLQQGREGGMMQDMEDALTAKTQPVEELNPELEEVRAAFGPDGIQQLQDFEAALKQRDGIITQLTANLQQAREEKDEIMKEFLELTEQSQKLQIQFQQLQAGEALRNTSHSSTAADLLQARQQLIHYQQQLEEMNVEVRKHQERNSEQLEHITDENIIHQSDEKDLIIAEQERVISERDCSLTQLEDDCKLDLEKERVELEICKGELATSRQKERMSSNEIMQLMGTVEDLQKCCHQGSLSESDTIQKVKEESMRKLDLLRAELDEMYGQQIVQMKQEINLQHVVKVEQMTKQHCAELEHLKAQQLSQSAAVSTAEKDSLNAKIRELQETLKQSKAMHDKTSYELSQVSQEKLNLQSRFEELLKEKTELVSRNLTSQESQQGELHRLQETIENLKSELAAAHEAAQEAETKHESEITNYKIKLEMLEREKDAVLDRMAESQEAELERLRTQLLFSHEEELTHLREELQRESFLNTENLLNEAAIKHERMLDELRIGYEEELHLLQKEKARFSTERDELLHQILGLKEDLKLALHSSKADELVQQLQELQLELEELRKGGEERVKMENEIQTLLKKTEVLENQTKEKEQYWENKWKEQESEKKTLIESNDNLKAELRSNIMKIEALTAENNQIQQEVAELREETEKQRTTFSFAEKNFEVNYQELKEEYTCLVEAKSQLEERRLKQTLDFEAKIASLQSQIRELEESSRDIKMEDPKTDGTTIIEKDTTELMEKLHVTLSEKESLAGRLSVVTEQLLLAESKVGQREEELMKLRQENAKVIAQNESLGKELERKQEIMREQMRGQGAQRKAKLQKEEQVAEAVSSFEDHHLQIQSLNLLREANQRLRQVLVDVLKTTAAAEETMGLHMQSLRDASGGEQQAAMPHSTTQRASTQSVKPYPAGDETSKDDVNVWSREAEADKGLEVAQQMMDNLLLGAGTQLENEEYVLGISSRLQTALKKMLMAITDTTNQLEHAQMTQTELMRESFHHSREITNLLQKQEELQERLSEEAQAREQLALELHRAESLIDGYTGERAALEEQLHQKEELQLSLEQELQVTSSRLHELEQERLQMQEERELLSRQQDAMREHAGPRELRMYPRVPLRMGGGEYLLEETEKLMKEKVEVQRQAEKENTDLLKQVKLLEVELEEQVNKVIELEHTQKTESGDLRQQIQALEKQLEKNRRFLDEQAVDREHERDFFQQEIQKLEQQLKNPQKLLSSAEQRNQEVDQLTSQLKEKADWCSELLLSTEQLRRELGERDEEIDKLESRIRELEQALLASAESLEKVREGEGGEGGEGYATHSTLEAQLQTEREALERKEKEIRNLEEQLEQFREDLENKSEEVQQLHMQLEIQKKEINTQQQYLETRDSLLQVMEEKDREIALLNEQITKLQHMETASDNKEIDERDEMIKDLESQVECLRSEQERLKRNNEEELDQLNAVIDKLQQELANIEQKQAAEEDEDTKGGLESGVWAPSKEEYDEIKQKMDLATIEFNTLKTEHRKLLDTYLILKESTQASAERQKLELEEALREKTAGVLVMQAQVQALEQSAMSRVEELELRIKELRDLVCEKDCEISRCRLLVEQTQSHADGLQQEVSTLEENLRAKVAAALVSQATLEAVQQQSQRSRENQDLQGHADPHVKPNVEPHDYDFGDFGIPKINFSALDQVRPVPMKKVKAEEDRTDMTELLQELQEVRNAAASTKEELSSCRQHNEKLQEDLKVREVSISKLKEELQEVINIEDTTKEELSRYRLHNEKLQHELQSSNRSHSSRLNSSSEQQHVAVTDSFTQTEPLQLSDLSPEAKSATKEEMEEVIGEFQEKIVQMQELHAAEILDMEARHISESENLRRDTQALEDECKALKAIIDKLRCTEVREYLVSRKSLSSADSSSDYSQRTGYELPSLQQEFRTTPEGARRETDDPLPDRIKTLLREVHQEGMQVLSLSELPLSASEPGSQFSVQGWVKERDALLATVESLKGLITQMQTRRETQTPGSVDWRGELLDAVQQVFLRERSVLKNALYNQLDLLDTSDAIIHFNQLERRLAELVKAMGLLHTAERASLISEIHQLRGQLEQLHQGEREADRLLLEELKGELSQTKLELETTLKAQHKHLKELDTLRAEVSQKAAEVDALNDQLMEERKRCRDLQWVTEKEKCRTGRTEERNREELEDLHLTLEEQKNRVGELTSALDQERQASSKLSQQAEQERLSLHSRLQELQVQLETERAKAQEMSTALGRERELRTGASSNHSRSTEERVENRRGLEQEESLLERLQRELDEKHAQVVHLLTQVEAQKLEVVRKEEELTLANQRSRRDKEELQEVQAQLESLEAQMSEAQEQLERELQRRRSLEEEKERLEERLNQTGEPGEERKESGSLQADGHSVSISSTGHDKNQLVCSSSKLTCQSPSWFPQSASLLTGGSSSSLTERLLRQNAELTGFVSRLTEEKNDLRNHTLRLEEELRRYRQAGLGSGDRSTSRRGVLTADSADMLLSQEREAWTREKVRLEKALRLAQAQVTKLILSLLFPLSLPFQRMYGKYLRSESFRKALIYQKKYLLLLLGGFQECEEATLSLLSRMGGRPSPSSLESLSQRRRGLMRFRSAVRVSIALSRMRFLVKRWHKATGMTSTASCTEMRDSPYLHPGSVDMYRERGSGGGGGVSSNRGRSGRESPRSAHSSTQQRFHLAGDHGPLTCSHLQSYDPDRALTDYISRLEALQRRLGSVTSG